VESTLEAERVRTLRRGEEPCELLESCARAHRHPGPCCDERGWLPQKVVLHRGVVLFPSDLLRLLPEELAS
jgi:hypothetical protein